MQNFLAAIFRLFQENGLFSKLVKWAYTGLREPTRAYASESEKECDTVTGISKKENEAMDFPKNFVIANKITAKWEKGLVDHPSDPGGITYNGVSLRFLQDIGMDIDGDGDVDADDIIKLARDKNQAKVDEVFYRYFWQKARLDLYESLPLQIAVYDSNVNTGTGQTAKFVQRAINTLSTQKVSVDGAIGPMTMAAMLTLVHNGQGRQLACVIMNERVKFYKNLASEKPKFKVFLTGWLNRSNDVRAYLDMVGE